MRTTRPGELMHRNVSNVRWLAAVLGLALAGCGSDSTAPSGRPAAGQIAFTSERDGDQEVYVMNADGSAPLNLSNNAVGLGNDWAPAWSPDGSKIAFISGRDGNDEIYVMKSDGSGQANLTNNARGDYFPAWSPHGSKIAFESSLGYGNGEV